MGSRKILLSVVIPVYNVKSFLVECVESICKGCDGDPVQIILVDDGSTDGSSELCDVLAREKRIEVFHKENGGLASARNYGLKRVCGEYVAFVDSDDKVRSDSFRRVLEYIRKTKKDVYFVNVVKLYSDGSTEDMGENISHEVLMRSNKEETLDYLSTRGKFPASACGKIYRTEFLSRNNLEFPKDNRISEDLGFSFDVIRCAASYDKIEEPYYEYRQNRTGSITNMVSSKSFHGVGAFVSEYSSRYLPIAKEGENRYLLSFIAYEYAILLMLYHYVEKKDRKAAKSLLTKYKKVLRYGRNRRLKVIRIMVALVGVDCSSRLLYAVWRRRG